MKASMALTRMMSQERKAAEMAHEIRKTLLTQGYVEVYGTEELVLPVLDFSKLEARSERLHPSTALPYGAK